MLDDTYRITTIAQLETLFDRVVDAVRKKEVPLVHDVYRPMIEASPFAVLATSGADGLDASPRGDAPGFVRIVDEKTLMLPERRGNNRADSLHNILHDPRIALLFLIPGVGETLRVNGRAEISIDPDLLRSFAVDGKPPKCVLIIHVESVFFQCARAILRSQLWLPREPGQGPALPSAGQVLAALTHAQIDGDKYDQELPARQRATLY